jgi:hypothetical protein
MKVDRVTVELGHDSGDRRAFDRWNPRLAGEGA